MLNREEELAVIVERMQMADDSLVKAELKRCAAELVAYSATEEDYEAGEALLNRLRQEFIPVLRECGLHHRHFWFTILLRLIDMYLQEGDVVAAEAVLRECRQVQQELGVSLEEIESYYALAAREAQLEISTFAFEKAFNRVSDTCESLRRIMRSIVENPFFQSAMRCKRWRGRKVTGIVVIS